MPLTELMHYFNDQLQSQARTKSLPKTGFYKVENGYWARFGSLTLGSHFHDISVDNADENQHNYYSELIVRSGTGKPLSIDEIFNSLDNTSEIVHLDRLTRTLHSLNYLQQFDGQKGFLALAVQPRHIVSVIAEHGKTFEAILSDCGLGPERVVLHTRLLDEATIPHFRNALLSYRSRGYLIGITVEKQQDLHLLNLLALQPDIIFYNFPDLKKHIDQLDYKNSRSIYIAQKNIANENSEISSAKLQLSTASISAQDFSQQADLTFSRKPDFSQKIAGQ